MFFVELPTDIHLAIFGELWLTDILAVRRACRFLDSVSRERSVWYDAVRTHVLGRGIPLPGLRGRSLTSLSAKQLEHLTLQALRLHSNWNSTNPVCSRQRALHPPTLPVSRPRNLAVYFLPGHANRWLITITLYDQPSSPRKYAIQCWDLVPQIPRCMATLRSMNVMGVTVNSEPDSFAVLALTCRGPSEMITTSIYTVDFSSSDPKTAFMCIKEFSSYRISIALNGTTFVASDSDNIVRLIDVESGQSRCELRVPLLYDDPTLRNEEHRCLGAVLFDHYVLTFCKQWIHLYSIQNAERPEPHPMEQPTPQLDPISKHKWQWRIDSLVVSPRRRGIPRTARSGVLPPIDILIRFDTWFPWPVNILHHFVLPPNPSYATAHAPLPYLFSVSPADGPFMAHSIPSPVRLFTPSDMVLGRYGTALWIDAQTDPNAPAQAGDHGQRIVGQLLADPPGRPPPTVGADGVSPGLIDSQYHSDGSRLADGRAPLMEFRVQEHDDGWNRLAIDEEEGRIAVGCVDGKVTLFEYMSLGDV